MPHWMLGILLAPLAYGLLRVAVSIVREREVRLAIPAGLLLVLTVRQFVGADGADPSAAPTPVDSELARFGIELFINALAAVTAHVVCASLVERNRAERTHWDSMEALRRMTDFLAGTGDFERRTRDLLALGARHLRVELGAIARIESGEHVVEVLHRETDRSGPRSLAEGEAIPLDETYCAHTLTTDKALVIESATGTHWEGSPAHERLELETYLGIALQIDGKAVGTLFFGDRSSRPTRFHGVDKMLLRVMASWLEAKLARERDRRASEARPEAEPAPPRGAPTLAEATSDRKRLVPRRGDDADRRRLDLAACLLHLEDELRERLGESRHLDLRLDPADLEARLYRYEFDRVLWSLVHHAAEWTPARGPVVITTSRISSADGAPEPVFVTLSVQTAESAPDASESARLFERHASAARPRDARRLPLWRAAEILRGVGGDLSLSVDAAGGATLTAYLPAAQRDA